MCCVVLLDIVLARNDYEIFLQNKVLLPVEAGSCL